MSNTKNHRSMTAEDYSSGRKTSDRLKAVIYLRSATGRQAGEPDSIAQQRRACRSKAKSLGATVDREFVDSGQSGNNLARPGLQDLLAYVAGSPIEYVIVNRHDRLARNPLDSLTIDVALSRAQVMLVSCTENIDRAPSRVVARAITSVMAEFYRRNHAQRSVEGRLKNMPASRLSQPERSATQGGSA